MVKTNRNIEAERARMQLTKEELSRQLGISQRTYLSYVRGETAIPSNILMAMARLFRCSTDYLRGLQSNPGADQIGERG